MSAGRLYRGVFTVGGWTMASRVLGFIRDMVIAAALGAGPVAEAFLIAFSLPNMFRRFFAEGAFNMAFVPMFSKRVEAGEGAHEFARDAFTGLATILIFFTALAQIFMPWLVLAMAAGFRGDERFDLAVLYGRIAFPYILFISLAALLSGVLNAVGRFAAAAAAPVLLNVIFITTLGAASFAGWDLGLTLAWSVPVAGIAQMALVWVAASRAGYRLIPRLPRMTPELKRLAIIAAPAALSGGVLQVNLLVGRQVASATEGAVAWINYADRIYQLPLGVVGIAIGVVLLPELSRRLKAEDHAGSREAMSRAGEMAMALTLPAAAACIAVAMPLVAGLFQRGAFGPDETAHTALALQIYAWGLPAFVLFKVLQPAYYARENTKTPFYFALMSMVVNAVFAIGLMPYLGYIAAPIGTTISIWAMVVGLWIGTYRMGETTRFDRRFWSRIWRILIASWAMGVFVWVLSFPLQSFFAAGGLWKGGALAVLIVAGCAFYYAAGHLLGAFTLRELKAAMKRG
ncbi:MAG: murein biosynthesis integral membrane protein MurJ [Rhodobacterales bacterium]|nr:MAG: murein biosynthesis integral membrane protein MurJ [Rhodobacterales bacterium]